MAQDIEKVVAVLAKSKAGKSLKGLHVGPPLDGLFVAETSVQEAELETFFTSKCPNLQIVLGWDLTEGEPGSYGKWSWSQLPNGALQGSELSQ